MHYIKRMSIVDALALQIAEQMVTICRATCQNEPMKIVDKLLSIDTVRPILDTLRNNKGTRVKFRKISWSPILAAKIAAVKMVSTQRFVDLLNSDEQFKAFLAHIACRVAAEGSDDELANKLANGIAAIILEPYNNNIVELFELRASSSGGRRTRKQKRNRRYKSRRNRRNFYSRRK